MPRSSHSAASASNSARGGTAPVGLFGKLTATSFVSGRSSASSSPRSGAQPFSGRSSHPLTAAPVPSVTVSSDW